MRDKNFILRTTSVAVTLPIVILMIYYNRWTCDILFLMINIVSLFEYEKALGINKILRYTTLAVGILFYCSEFIPNMVLGNAIKICSAISLLILGLFINEKQIIVGALESVCGVVYISLSFCLFRRIGFLNFVYDPSIILGIFCLVWSNDTFAYLIGKALGKHKFFPRISPKKTIEGVIGGFVGVFLCSATLGILIKTFSKEMWIAIGILVMIFGTLGDLIASAIKRSVEIKDFGTLIPGHGGFIDRFDSLIFVIPYIYLTYIAFI